MIENNQPGRDVFEWQHAFHQWAKAGINGINHLFSRAGEQVQRQAKIVRPLVFDM